jgi:Type I phosphodiesterase / nucleotide pyrophosphatase
MKCVLMKRLSPDGWKGAMRSRPRIFQQVFQQVFQPLFQHRFLSGSLRSLASFAGLAGLVVGLVVACAQLPNQPSANQLASPAATPHNAIIFVADGLRHASVNTEDMPTLATIRQMGVNFDNSHSLFPTFTTANASAIATGHYIGDTGDFSNTVHVGFPVKAAKNSLVPFLENNAVLGEVNQFHQSNYLNEESLLAIARKAGFSTAAVGKIGPVLIQDISQNRGESTIVIDDATGTPTGVPLSAAVTKQLKTTNLPLETPSRGANGKPGNSNQPGAKVANIPQQQYFVDVTTKVILPMFKQRQKPFVMVYWSRDPDGTQHNQGDSLNQLVPGINGPTSQAARQNADKNLAQLRTALQDLGLDGTTNIFVTSDHGFSTISKESKTSYAATQSYPEVPKGFLPPGFLAIDLAKTLGLSLFDADKGNAPVDPSKGQFAKNAAIAQDAKKPLIMIAGNGGSDLIYVLNREDESADLLRDRKVLTRKLVEALLQQDYVSGLFVDDSLGDLPGLTPPGTLPLSAIQLKGNARMPMPSIVVNFRSFDTGCGNPTACGAEIADTGLQQGQGMHGSFSRADTYNTMVAIGPDFKTQFTDAVPVSNADVAQTIARILNLNLPARGNLVGRVLQEALVNQPDRLPFEQLELASKPSVNGLKTILKYQSVGATRYFDVAGFPGRTLGLNP